MQAQLSPYKLTLSVLAVLALCLAPATARGTPNGFADLVEDLAPAVVSISSSQNLGSSFGENEQLRRFEDKLNNPAVSLGSGFIIDSSGIVVTNNHVIEGADEIKVTMEDGTEYDADAIGIDQETDLAVLQIRNAPRLPAVEFGDSRKLRVGDWVLAIGGPFGLGGSVSAGIVSAQNRDIRSGLYDDYIQTDAAINRGNSGGPLFNTDGEVVGINTAIFSQTGGSVGVGFAVPSELAEGIVRQLREFGETMRGWLGVNLADLSPEEASDYGLEDNKGAMVMTVRSNSPALRGGMQSQDFVIRYDGKEIAEVRDLTRAVADTPVGKTVTIRVLREGRPVNLRVTIDRRETNFAALGSFELMQSDLPSGAAATSGMILQQPTMAIRDAFGLDSNVEGVVVTAVDPDSPAASVLRPGDVILELGYQPVENPDDLVERMEKLRNLNSGPLQIFVQRGDMMFYELIRP